MGIIAAFAGLLSLIFGLVGLGFYVLMALGLSGVAKKAGIENSWLAWIPIANLYLMGKIIGTLNLFGKEINDMEKVLPIVSIVACIASSVLTYIPIVGAILGLVINVALIVFMVNCFYSIYKMYKDTSNKGSVILSIIFFPIFLFTIKDAEPIGNSNNNSVNM